LIARELIDPIAVVAALCAADRDCYDFMLQWQEGTAFVGATPERLFQLRDTVLKTECMAGTVCRGADDAADRSLAKSLLENDKDRLEHACVVEAVLDDLRHLCVHFDAVPEPHVVRLATLQHLSSILTGRLRPGVTVSEVLKRLHPTPAVGGWPRETALALIRGLESQPRGWYAGPVGWIGTEAAEFAVAIRSALITGTEACAFAGAGIVTGSDPESEWQETEDKLQALAQAVNTSASQV
jgi:menaquinone-specific isochorismate synthase